MGVTSRFWVRLSAHADTHDRGGVGELGERYAPKSSGRCAGKHVDSIEQKRSANRLGSCEVALKRI